jgi:YVTN family beta-propeller protein
VKRDGVVRAYVPTRDDNSLNVLTLDAAAGPAPAHIQCDQRAGEGGERECGGASTIDMFAGQLDTEPMAADPLGLATDARGLFVTHVGRGVVSRWAFGDQEPLDFGCSLALQFGATSVAVHPLLDWAYVTDRAGELVQVVAPLEPGQLGQRGVTTREECRLEPRTPITVDDPLDGASTRGIAFSADGTLLYVANTVDESLRIYDTSVGAGGVPRNRLVAAIPIGGGVDVVRVAGLRPGERAAPLGAGEAGYVDQIVAAKGQGLVYVTAFDDDRVTVVDPTTMSVVARIDVGDGPHEIAFMPDGDGHLRGYVADFNGQSLSVLDLEPGSASRFTLLATVPPTESR